MAPALPLRFAIAGLLFSSSFVARAQNVGIGTTTPDTKAALEISATDKGLLIPRMDSAQRVAITPAPDGLMVFQVDGRRGFWYAVGGTWYFIPDKTRSGDNLGTHTATQNLDLGPHKLVGNGGNAGIYITSPGNVAIGTTTTNGYRFSVNGSTNLLGGVQVGSLAGTGSRVVTADATGLLTATASLPTTESTTAGNGLTLSGTQVQLGGTLSQATTVALNGNNFGFTGTGNVGIASTAANSRLSISSNSAEPKITLYDNGDAANHYGLGVSSSQLNYHVRTTGASHVFYAAGKNADGTELLRMKGTGHVGIGTAAPTALLDVNGSTRLRGLTTAGLVTTDANGNLSSATSLPAGVTGDDLGNHTATQSLNLGTNKITGNGSTRGLSIGANGRLITDGTNLLVGNGAGSAVTTGLANVLLGYDAGPVATSGYNTLVGTQSGKVLTTGEQNAFLGFSSGAATTTGTANVLLGNGAGQANITGVGNTAVGYQTNVGTALSNATALGYQAAVSQSNSLVLGGTGATAVKVGIGTPAPAATLHVAGSTSTVRLAGLAGTDTRLVTADATGDLGTTALPIDAQQLSLTGASLSISNGNSVTLPDASAANELQTIFRTGNIINLSDGGGSFVDNDTDAQTLSVSGGNLSISGGNSVGLSSLGDNLGNHTATQRLDLGLNQLVGQGGISGISINTVGLVGIGTTTPAYRLHVTGGDTRLAAIGGEQALFGLDRLVGYNDLRFFVDDAGAAEVMRIENNGNVGINTGSPGARLDVAGSFRLGTDGTVLASVIKTTVTKNVSNIPAGGGVTEDFSVANAAVGATVYISPANDLTNGINIAYARVSAAGTVRVKFSNSTGADVNPASMNFYITVIQ